MPQSRQIQNVAFTTNDKSKIIIFDFHNLSYDSLFALPYDFLYQR